MRRTDGIFWEKNNEFEAGVVQLIFPSLTPELLQTAGKSLQTDKP